MAKPRIVFDEGTSVLQAIDLTTVNQFQGGVRRIGAVSVSVGNTAYANLWDVAWEYDVSAVFAIKGSDDGTRNANITALEALLLGGYEFIFTMDGDKQGDTTLTSAWTFTASPPGAGKFLTVADSSNFATNDWIVVEADADPYQFLATQVTDVPSGTRIDVNNKNMFDASFGVGSLVRHRDYFPKCVCLSDGPIVQQRQGGEGLGYDMRFRFRRVV